MPKPIPNADVREYAAKNEIRLWEIADELGYSPSKLTITLRRELGNGAKLVIFDAIDRVDKKRKAEPRRNPHNYELKAYAKKQRVCLYEVAQWLNTSATTLCNSLKRDEYNENEKKRFLDTVDEIAKNRLEKKEVI